MQTVQMYAGRGNIVRPTERTARKAPHSAPQHYERQSDQSTAIPAVWRLPLNHNWQPGNPEEVWRPVVGYEDRYQISSLGRVSHALTGLLIRTYWDSDGHEVLKVKLPGRKAAVYLPMATIVATAFLPNPKGCTNVGHLNGNLLDNIVSNLQWIADSASITPNLPDHE